ncbi:MAG: hypothetical protein ACK4UJ_07140 [Leptonema sp. (in: bacteria)]
MKKSTIINLIYLFTCFLWGQDINLQESDPIFEPAKQLPQTQLTGFLEDGWGTPFTEILDKFKSLATSPITKDNIQILHLEKNRYILIKRNNINYQYNFYKIPYEVLRLQNHEVTKEEYEQKVGELYQVRVILPFIDSKLLEQKLEAAYGKKTKSTVDEKTLAGVDIWDLEGGYIFLWYEPYNKKAFSRRIDFISKTLSERILKESKDYFDSKEKQLLKDLIIK